MPGDIERLDGRIDKAGDRCDRTHRDLGKSLLGIEKALAKLEERMVSAFGELDDGDTAFKNLNQRVADLESQTQRWKGNLSAFILVLTIAIQFIIQGVKMAFSYFSKGGGN